MTDQEVPGQSDEPLGFKEVYRRAREVDRDCSFEAVRRYMQEIDEMERAIDRLLSDAPQYPNTRLGRLLHGAAS